MDLQDLDRIGFVTRHFQDLQGLKVLVPVGMMILFQGLSPFFDHLPAGLGWVCLVAIDGGALLLILGSRRYYRTLLGEVEARPTTTLGAWLPAALLAAGVLSYLLAVHSLSIPRLQCVLYGSPLLGMWLYRGKRWSQSYHLLLGGLLLGVAVLGPGDSYAAQREIAYTLSGASWILAGLLDHRQLVRILGQLPPPAFEPEAAAESEARR